MKRLIAFISLTFATSGFAGVVYQIQSTSTGPRSATISGKVAGEGQNIRMDVITGDKMLFNDNTILLSTDGGATMNVYDPATKNYFEIRLDDVLGSATSMLKNLPGEVKVSFENPQVTVREAGDGGTIEGFPTRRYVMDASYDVVIDAMGQKMSTHTRINTESWTTEQLSADFTSFLQMRGFHTGIDTLDKLIKAQSEGIKGMPLKQVSTITINQGGGSDMTITTNSLVTHIERKPIDASQFVAPAGYTKVDDPITRMMKQIKQ